MTPGLYISVWCLSPRLLVFLERLHTLFRARPEATKADWRVWGALLDMVEELDR